MDANFLLLPEFDSEPARNAGRRGPPTARRNVPDRPSVAMRRLAAHEHVFEPGMPADEIYELVQGAVLTTRTLPDGRRQIVDVIGPGRLFGFTASDRHLCSAVVASSALVCGLDAAAARRNPRVAERIEREALAEIDRLRDLALSLGRRTAIERVARFFWSMTGERAASVVIDLPLSRLEIADHLGLTIETVCRQITGLRRDGILESGNGNRFRVTDPARLARLAKGEE